VKPHKEVCNIEAKTLVGNSVAILEVIELYIGLFIRYSVVFAVKDD